MRRPFRGIWPVVIVGLVVGLALAVFTPGASSAAGKAHRPFKASLAGSAGAVPDLSCPLGFRTVSEGSGTASHLGLVEMTSGHCFVPPNLNAGGHMTLVAANGDELHMTYEGTSDPGGQPPLGGLVTVHTHHVVVGGTGRFASATGEADTTALVVYMGPGVPWPATWTMHGTLGD